MTAEQSTKGTKPTDGEATNPTDGVTSEETKVSTQEKSQEITSSKPSAEDKKKQIISSFQERLDSGELTLEEVEARQPWVAEALKSKAEEKGRPAVDPETLKKEILEEVETKRLLEDFESSRPTKAQREEYYQTISEYEKSLGKRKAIELASKLVGFDPSPAAKSRRSAAMPYIGGAVETTDTKVTAEDKAMGQRTGVDPKVIAQRRLQLEQSGRVI